MFPYIIIDSMNSNYKPRLTVESEVVAVDVEAVAVEALEYVELATELEAGC